MSYLVLARKWRPQGFGDLIGQEPIVKVLENSISQGKIAHAYVFSGPRGVGKTSTARILAKSLNCSEGPTSTPCGKCPSCVSIVDGSSVDVMEIDGASNNGVDHIRDLRERVKYAPSEAKHKVYIIDEAHMLSTPAFNALLKTLEEPPSHVIFILATTESRKIPLTVLSRCQHLPFRRVSTQTISERLKLITQKEDIGITEGALALVARAADGSIRDSLTILDQVTSFSDNVDETDIKDLLDIADYKSLAEVASSIIEGDREKLLLFIAELVEVGTDLRSFAKDLIKFFRDILVVKLSSGNSALAVDASHEETELLKHIASHVSDEHLTLVLSELLKTEADVRSSFSPRVALEMSLLRLSYLSTFRTVSDAIAAISSGGGVSSQSDYNPVDSGSADILEGMPKLSEPAKKKKITPQVEEQDLPESGDIAVHPPETDAPEVHHHVQHVDADPSATFTGESLLHAISERMDSPLLSSKLEVAKPELKGNVLTLTFEKIDADLCAKPFKDDPTEIEKIASSITDSHIRIEIHINSSSVPAESGVEFKEKVMSDPVVKDALDLFGGRVIDIKKTK